MHMVGLMSLLLGEVLFEGAKFIIMLLLLVLAVIVGGKLKTGSDARKAKKAQQEADVKEDTVIDNN